MCCKNMAATHIRCGAERKLTELEERERREKGSSTDAQALQEKT
jgi:hypothetical protein